MKASLLDLHEWIARIGVRHLGWAPEIAELVQPVALVADHRRLVSYPRARDAIAGCAGSFPAALFNFQLRCLSPGGLVVHWFSVGNENATNPGFVRFGIQAVDATAFTEPGAATVQSLNPDLPVRSIAGTLIGAPTTGPGNIILGAGGTGGSPAALPVYPLELYVPAGRAFIVSTYVVGQSLHMALSFTEYDAAVL